MPFRPLNNTSQTTSQQNSDGFRILADPNGNPINQNQDFQMESLQPTPQQPQDGFLKGLAKGIARPFLEVGATINNTGNAVGSLVKGGFSQEAANQATRNLNTSYNLPFFGETKPAFTGSETLPESFKKQAAYGTQIASTILPVGKVGTGVKGVAKTAGLFGGVNALGEAGRQITEGEKFDPAKIGASATIGALIPVGSAGVKKVLDKIPETAWSALLKRTPTEAAKNPRLAREIAGEGVTGISRKDISNKLGERIQDLEVQLDDLLTNKSGTIDMGVVGKYLDDLKNTYAGIPGEENAVTTIENIQRQFGQKGKIGYLDSNKIKRSLYDLVKKSYGRGTLESPAKIESQKIAASGIKQELEKAIPEVKGINEKMAIYIQAKNAIDKAAARAEGKGIAGTGIGMYDLLLGGAGTFAGGPTGALGAVAVKKIAESPAVLSGLSQQAIKLLRYFDTLSPTKKLLMYNALRVFGDKTQSSIYKNS